VQGFEGRVFRVQGSRDGEVCTSKLERSERCIWSVTFELGGPKSASFTFDQQVVNKELSLCVPVYLVLRCPRFSWHDPDTNSGFSLRFRM
jgi:hypothetical protein